MNLLVRHFLIASVPVLTFGIFAALLLSRTTEAQIEGQRVWSIEEVRLRASRIEAYFAGRRSELRLLAAAAEVREGGLARRLAYLREREAVLPGRFEGLYWNEPDGFAFASDGTRFDVRDRFYQEAVARGEPVLTPSITSRATGERVVLALEPVFASGGDEPRRVGALGATIEIETLLAELHADAQHHGGVLALMEPDGSVLARTDLALPSLEAALREIPADADFVPVDIDGRRFRATLQPIEESPGWRLALVYPRDRLLATADQLTRGGVILLAVAAGLALLLAYWAHRTVVRPIRSVIDAHQRFGRGETDARAPDTGPAEIAGLARSFNRMAERVVAEASRRDEAEQRVRRAQRLESVGLLAGGVAHDFNNLLTVILGRTEELRTRDDPAAREQGLVEIEHAARHGAELTGQLLGFARRQPSQPCALEMRGFLEDMRSMLRRLVPESVSVSWQLPDEPLYAHADSQQLEQVMLNLTVNARDAMPRGGKLEIALRAEPERSAQRPIVISVRDTGTGIPPEHLDRIFDPFFTTKGPNRGSGLGLASCHGILTQLGGEISVESTPGHGSTFRVKLRAASPDEATQGLVPSEKADVSEKGRRILLVEDEPAVRQVVARMLERAGHTVLAAEDAAEALEILAQGEAVQMLLTDLVMPGMGGVQLAECVHRMRPGLPVLFISGYARNPSGEPLPGRLLHKPVGAEELARAVREVAEEAAAAA